MKTAVHAAMPLFLKSEMKVIGLIQGFCTVTLSYETHVTEYDYLNEKLRDLSIESSRINGENAEDCVNRAFLFAGDGFVSLLCVPAENFFEVKYELIKHLGGTAKQSKKLEEAFKTGNYDVDSNRLALLTAVPPKSKVFDCSKPEYSAVAFPSGEGIIVLMSSESQIVDEVFDSGLDTLFNAGNRRQYKISDVKEKISQFISTGKTVAVADTGMAAALIAVINTVEGSDKCFIIDSSDFSARDGDNDSIAFCAGDAREHTGCDYGIAISPVQGEEGSGSSVFVSVAGTGYAKVAQVHALENEDNKQLMSAAVMKLCAMLSQAGSVEPELYAPEGKGGHRVPLAIIAVAIAAAVIICGVIAGISYAAKRKIDLTAKEETTAQHTSVTTSPVTILYEMIESTVLQTIEATTSEITETVTFSTTAAPSTTQQAQTQPETTTAAETTTEEIETTAAAVFTKRERTTAEETTESTGTTAVSTSAQGTTGKETSTSSGKTTTEKKVTTTKAASTNSSGKAKGMFVFTVYGYGHGVGLSQEGAVAMANSGSSYADILTHYFPGTSVKNDPSTPETVTYGGSSYSTLEYLCRTVSREIGNSSPFEALKAQACAAYTYAKAYKFVVPSSKHAFQSLSGKSFSDYYSGKNTLKACMAVLGMNSMSDKPSANYLDYKGKAASTYYFASAAGKTTSSSAVWGGSQIDYLCGGVTSPEQVSIKTVELPAATVKECIQKYSATKNADLSGDPSTWIKIVSHDGAVSGDTGYISTISVGGIEIRGYRFRTGVMLDSAGKMYLRSHCFKVEYIG
ncbi:MAG: hypothetical protein K6B52_00215 [Clostridiales bacterium]|nr:hypothetical protein [Clostridiales bacterium]